MGDLEGGPELGGCQASPVVEFEGDLQIDRDLSEGEEEQLLVLAAGDEAAWRGAKIRERDGAKVEGISTAAAASKVVVVLIASDCVL